MQPSFKIVGLFAFCLMAMNACTSKVEDQTPAKTLESYIEASFNVKDVQDKVKMENLLTGDTKQRLSVWSDEQFLKAFVETKKKFGSLKILENKKVNDQEAILTYELSFREGEKDKLAQITQRKLCTMVKLDGGWKIKEVRSQRESIEYLSELSLP
jgi:hypothetical protein